MNVWNEHASKTFAEKIDDSPKITFSRLLVKQVGLKPLVCKKPDEDCSGRLRSVTRRTPEFQLCQRLAHPRLVAIKPQI